VLFLLLFLPVFKLITTVYVQAVEKNFHRIDNKPSNRASTTYWPTEDWLESTPEEQGMDPTKLSEMMEYIDENSLNIESLLIVRNGFLVFEEYPDPTYNKDRKHILFSVTKSFTSALMGIAIQEGFVDSVEEKVLNYFPGREFANLDSRKRQINIEHLLTMTAGLEYDEWSTPYTSSQNDYNLMIQAEDSVQFVLDKPMVADPGAVWTYSTGATQILSAIIDYTTGDSTLDFAHNYLFGPLGITDVRWPADGQGINYGGSMMQLKPRDMAKFGYLYLHNGTWNNEQIVPAEWVKKSTETITQHWEHGGYGYQWWTYPPFGIYAAQGYNSQSIFVIPNHNMVVVFTANIGSSNPEPGILFNYIIPAALSTPVSESNFDIMVISLPIALVVPLLLAIVCWILKTRTIKNTSMRKK
jgi:CubicO group peptidase (beta-lactamase class C family)